MIGQVIGILLLTIAVTGLMYIVGSAIGDFVGEWKWNRLKREAAKQVMANAVAKATEERVK